MRAEPSFMQNRELSWLKFNERVLQEANRIETPLLERLKFIAIFTSNLDEFFMIRVGSLTDYAILGEKYADNKTGMGAKEQLREIFNAVAPLYVIREQAYSLVVKGLVSDGVEIMKMEELSGDELIAMKELFIQDILPLLSPQIVDSRHPFPHLANKGLYIAVRLERKKGSSFGVFSVPAELDRMVFLDDGNCRFVLLEDLILYFADLAFDVYAVTEKNVISVTRNADLDTEEALLDEDIDYRQHMKNLLKRRPRLSPVRLEMAYPASDAFIDFFRDKLKLSISQVYISYVPIDLSFCFSIERKTGCKALKRMIWPPHAPAEALPKKGIMPRLSAGKDVLLSYPFESISPFLELIHQASEDAAVLSIKITLYRIDIHSKLAESLIRAADNGKEVIVLMELRARFDENNNIKWAQRLEEEGCRVFFGPVGYKVHCKLCLITRKEYGKIQFITQIGTGNYNEKTASQYTDLSLITANQDIGRDASGFFTDLLLGNLERDYKYLWAAPKSFKHNILEQIEEERRKARNNESGQIIIKCNSLTDKEIIEKLAEASMDGVSISMNIRGICCLVPQIPDLTENISVVSIVGRFLEHSRIFCFGSGANSKIYISSADLMTRNTERRVEIACPILDADLRERIYYMLETMLMDNTQAWEQFADGRYIMRSQPDKSLAINSQEIFTQEAQMNAQKAESDKGKNDSYRYPMLTRIALHLKKLFRV